VFPSIISVAPTVRDNSAPPKWSKRWTDIPQPGDDIGAYTTEHMVTVVYICPNVGVRVQGWFADDGTDDSESYDSVTCLACQQLHFVNKVSGKVLGAADD
jgi:hypothetical protein